MYESPAYWELKKTITHWQTVQRYIDLARTFRSMAYGATLELRSTNGMYDTDNAHELVLKDSLKKDLLEFAAKACEETAVKIAASPPKEFDVMEACKI